MINSQVGIAVILSSAPPNPVGGSESQAYKLFSKIKERGHSVFLISTNDTCQTSSWGNLDLYLISNKNLLLGFIKAIKKIFRPQKLKSNKITQIEYDDSLSVNNSLVTKLPTLSFFIWFIPLLLKYFVFLRRKRKDFDVIYIPIMEAWALLGCIIGHALNKPVIIKDATMNGIINILRYPFGSYFQNYIIRRTKHFVAISKAIENNFISAGIDERKIIFIPNGIEIKKIERSPITGYCLFIGNLYQQPAKGIDILLKAWVKIQENSPFARLYVVGDGNLGEYISYTSLLGIQNSVTFVGKQQDTFSYLSKAEILILPSRREGLSNVLLEALLAGVPVVATDISGNQDLITDGVNGFLVEVSNVDELARKTCTLLSDENLRLKFSELGNEIIKNKYDIDKVADEYMWLLNKI